MNTVISGNNSCINISVGGSVTVNGQTISGNGQSNGKVVVAISLPEIQKIGIEGSSDVQLNDLQQTTLELAISGSGDIEANGSVGNLTASIAGSGDIDAEELIAQHITLSIAGSGDAELHAKQSTATKEINPKWEAWEKTHTQNN